MNFIKTALIYRMQTSTCFLNSRTHELETLLREQREVSAIESNWQAKPKEGLSAEGMPFQRALEVKQKMRHAHENKETR